MIHNDSSSKLSDEGHDDAPVASSPQARTHTNAKEIIMAYGRIRRFFKKSTPLRQAHTLMPGFKVYVKEEFTFRTGSFKERGALNSLLLLTDEERKRGVVVASAGNHSGAMSYHASRLGVPLTVFMPTVAPLTKVNQCMNFGAKVEIYGENLNIARERAMEFAEENEMLYINGYNDPAIVNGAGSCGVEIMEQLPDVEVIVVAVGGGGLIAGVAAAAKQRNPAVKIIGVESASCPSMSAALAAGEPVKVETMPTLADGAQVPLVGAHAFEVAKNLIDECIVVQEKWICLAMVRAIETLKVTLEGGGALGVAAMLSGQLDHIKNMKSVFILTGGNIDITTLGRVIERGLFADERLLRLSATISDSPGALVAFLNHVADFGCTVKDIQQERSYIQSRSVQIRIQIETRGKQHTADLLKQLKEEDYDFTVETDSGKYRRPPTPPKNRSGNADGKMPMTPTSMSVPSPTVSFGSRTSGGGAGVPPVAPSASAGAASSSASGKPFASNVNQI